jgi:hypothetical protein
VKEITPKKMTTTPVKESSKPVSGTVLSCTCNGIDQRSSFFERRNGESVESGSRKSSLGTGCTCDGKQYDKIILSLSGSVPPAPGAFDAGRMASEMLGKTVPLSSADIESIKRRMNSLIDDMHRSFWW